jgi:hypothetical protein
MRRPGIQESRKRPTDHCCPRRRRWRFILGKREILKKRIISRRGSGGTGKDFSCFDHHNDPCSQCPQSPCARNDLPLSPFLTSWASCIPDELVFVALSVISVGSERKNSSLSETRSHGGGIKYY